MTDPKTDLLQARPHFERLQVKLADRTAVCGVVGLGYVGLPLVGTLHDAGYRVLGFDVDSDKIEHLEAGSAYLGHVGEELPRQLARSSSFESTTNFTRLAECDAILVCVPTPVDSQREPDLSYVEATARSIGEALQPGQLIVLESTTYPTTTRDVFLPAILSTSTGSPRLGNDLFVAFSPEREDPGRSTHRTKAIPKLVGGLDEPSTRLATALFAPAFDHVVPVQSAEIAESAKILENVFRAVNIAMVNEMKMLFDRMDIDIWEVIQAASTKPFGFMPFHPGPGLGGHCIPVDPFYLAWKARECGLPTRFIELAGEINHAMPEYVVGRCLSVLNEHSKSVSESHILIIGMAYKANIDDIRETPSVEIALRLKELGASVDYHDPHVPEVSDLRKHPGFRMLSVDLSKQLLASTDLIIIATDHDALDWDLIGASAGLIVDTRNAMARVRGPVAAVVCKA